MGRQLKRVPMNFDWPLNQVWKGYINPYNSQECKSCGNTGLNPATKKLSDNWYGFSNDEVEWIQVSPKYRYNNKAWSHHLTQDEVDALVKNNRLIDFTHIWDKTKGWQEKNPPYHPTAEEVNKWSISGGMGHDSINSWICIETRAKRLGVYGKCKYCKGEGEIWQSEEIRKLHEKWQREEPPKGKGFQLWENTSEGSPISPVFSSLEGLCSWAENNATTFASFKVTAKEWHNMLTEDLVIHKEKNAVFI